MSGFGLNWSGTVGHRWPVNECLRQISKQQVAQLSVSRIQNIVSEAVFRRAFLSTPDRPFTTVFNVWSGNGRVIVDSETRSFEKTGALRTSVGFD